MKINKPQIMTAHVRTTSTGTTIQFTQNKPKMIIKVRPKLSDKKYYKHTGYPGGIKMQTPEAILSSKFPERILKKAVERMMPSGPLANKQLKNLKVYSGSDHPHESQKPELLDFKSMNEKNGKR